MLSHFSGRNYEWTQKQTTPTIFTSFNQLFKKWFSAARILTLEWLNHHGDEGTFFQLNASIFFSALALLFNPKIHNLWVRALPLLASVPIACKSLPPPRPTRVDLLRVLCIKHVRKFTLCPYPAQKGVMPMASDSTTLGIYHPSRLWPTAMDNVGWQEQFMVSIKCAIILVHIWHFGTTMGCYIVELCEPASTQLLGDTA